MRYGPLSARHSADPGSGGGKYRTGKSSETETYAGGG